MQEFLQFILDFYIIPVFLWLVYLHQMFQKHDTAIKIIESMALQAKEIHDKEIRDTNEMFNKVYNKLDKLEEFLRSQK